MGKDAEARRGRSALWALSAAGVLLTSLYAVGTARIALPSYFPEPGITLDFVKMLGGTWQATTRLYVGFVLLAFALYGTALWAARQGTPRRTPRWVVAGFPVLFAVALLGMYPPTAVDLFHYHADGRTLWVHGQNPLLVPPIANPYPVGMSWADQASPYGAVWSLLVGVAVVPTGDHFVEGLLGLKAIAAASYLASVWLIWRIVSRARPGNEALAVVLFAWNPFVVLRVIGNGHNDMVMMLLVLIALERAQVRDWWLVLQALVLSVLIKYATALIVPSMLLYAWRHAGDSSRQRARALAVPAMLAALTVVLAFVPFWEGLSTFDTVRVQAGRAVTSTPLLLHALIEGPSAEGEPSVARWPLRLGFLAAAALLTWQARANTDRLVTSSFTILFLYLVVAADWFRPWYFLWPAAFAALRPRSWLAPMLVVMTFFGSFPDLVEQFRGHWTWLDTYEKQIAAPIVLAFAPPSALWLWGVLRHRSWHFGVGMPDTPRNALSPAPGGPTEAGLESP